MDSIQQRLAAITFLPRSDGEGEDGSPLFLAELEKRRDPFPPVRGTRTAVWRAQMWVKEGILLAFRTGVATRVRVPGALVPFIETRTRSRTRRFPARQGRHPHRARRIVGAAAART